MLSISRGTGGPDARGPGRRRGWFAVSVGVNVAVLGLFLRALTLHDRWYEQFTQRPGDVPAERISFLRLPPGQTSQAGRSGGDGRPPRSARPTRSVPRFVPPTTAAVPAPSAAAPEPSSAQTAGAAEGAGGSGEVIGDGGPAAGMRPTYADPRLWRRPDVAVSAPKSAKQRVDSVIADRLGPVRDSIALAQEIAAGQRKPGDWTVNGPGGKWGVDPPGQGGIQNIHLGKIKVPVALLGLLTSNLQKNLRSNPNELANERRLAQARREIMDHAASGMAEDDFRGAVRAIRARKDRERNERLAERRRAAEASTADDGAAQP